MLPPSWLVSICILNKVFCFAYSLRTPFYDWERWYTESSLSPIPSASIALYCILVEAFGRTSSFSFSFFSPTWMLTLPSLLRPKLHLPRQHMMTSTIAATRPILSIDRPCVRSSAISVTILASTLNVLIYFFGSIFLHASKFLHFSTATGTGLSQRFKIYSFAHWSTFDFSFSTSCQYFEWISLTKAVAARMMKMERMR